MFTLFPKVNNLNRINKICLAGFLIALDILAQKVFAINYLAFAPFLRISFAGPCIIIFASIFLGPIYGLIVGTFGDILGYLIFDPKSYPLFLQITLIYAVLGFVSYFIFKLVKKINNYKFFVISLIVFPLVLLGIVTWFLFSRTEIILFSSTYTLEMWQKWLTIGLLFFLFAVLIAFIFIYDKKAYKREKDILRPLQTGFAALVIELFIMVIFGSLMKAWAFGFQTYLVILLTQIMVLFINVSLNTILLTLLNRAIFPKYGIQKNVE